MYPFMSYTWYVTTVNIGPRANFFRCSLVWVPHWEIRSQNQLMNFLMHSFANHDSLCPGLSLSNISLCISKYSDTMDICWNTWKWIGWVRVRECILSNYIEMVHYKYLNVILLTCSLSTSSSNQHMTHTQSNSFPLHHLLHYHPYYTKFKMINLTHMISILNSVFTIWSHDSYILFYCKYKHVQI